MRIRLYLSRLIGFLGPLVFLLLYTASIKHPDTYDPLFIRLQQFLPAEANRGPLLPTKHSQAWQIGKISGLLATHSISNETAVTTVASVLSVPAEHVSVDAILGMGSFLEQHEQHKTGWAKVLGVWSFVNVMWVLSIIGIAATVGPVFYILFGPMFTHLLSILRTCILYIHYRIFPLYSLLFYYICLCILTSAPHYPPTLAPFIAFTGCALAIPTIYLSLYQTHLNLDALESRISFSTATINFFAFYTFSAAAISTTSSLLAFISIVALFSALGFQVIPFTCGWLIGYSNTFTMLSSMTASTTLLLSMLTLKHLNLTPSALTLFEPGVSIMGGVALGVAGLILTSYWYRNRDFFLFSNLLYFITCGTLIVAGSVLHLTPLRCTASVFLVLWGSLKVAEVTSSKYMIVLIFVGSAVSWHLSFFLKAHPEYIMSLFNMFNTA